ncbi:MAG: SAM-dependent methyltransferase [Gammaproteobacteria bacterium]
MHSASELPAPSAAGLAQSSKVRAAVVNQIAEGGGFLSFADYMALVLYAPGLGYYSAGARKFGVDGDFITAPEMGTVFARCMARIVSATLAQLGGGVVLEVGGGSGALAADLLNTLRDQPPEHYYLLEVSGDLRERQARTLANRVPDLAARLSWLDELPASPVNGVVLANEVLDAQPVERFRLRAGSVFQLGVTHSGGELRWAERAAPGPLRKAVVDLQEKLGEALPDGYVSEICLQFDGWLQSLLGSLQRGLVVFIDYGGTRREIYHPDRNTGTLACHFRHRMHTDPFRNPGLQDLTAWVDFSAVADIADRVGMPVAAYGTQAHALLASGVLDQSTPGVPADAHQWRERQEIQRLLMPGEMGERFKVLALARNFVPEFPLTVRDLRDRL